MPGQNFEGHGTKIGGKGGPRHPESPPGSDFGTNIFLVRPSPLRVRYEESECSESSEYSEQLERRQAARRGAAGARRRRGPGERQAGPKNTEQFTRNGEVMAKA